MKRRLAFIILNLFVFSSTALSQDLGYDKSQLTNQKQFESTLWMPAHDVDLLSIKSSIQVWQKLKDVGLENIYGLSVFRTKHLYILVFNAGWTGTQWEIYNRKDNSLEFRSEGISGGYGPKGPKDHLDSCSSGVTSTQVNFRQYTKTGPLLLEVYVPGCRKGAAHHEFLFHLDGESLEEVEGSRFVMNDYYNYTEKERGWRWWPKDDHYVRLGQVYWNSAGEMQWTRKLNTRLLSLTRVGGRSDSYDYPQPEVHRHCGYSKTTRAVHCETEVVRSVTLKARHFLDFRDKERNGGGPPTPDYLEDVLRTYPYMADAGYILPKQELTNIKRALSKLRKGK